MQKQVRNLIIGIGGFIIFIALAQFVMMQGAKSIAFDYQIFEKYLPTYIDQDQEYTKTKQSVEEYIDFVLTHESPDSINESIYDILPETGLNISYVSYNDDQLREIAYEVLQAGAEYFNNTDVKMLDTVYAVEERVAVYLGSPRSYLYFVLTPDGESMVAMSVTATKDGVEIVPLWDIEKAADDDFVVQETNRYLYIYTNQIF